MHGMDLLWPWGPRPGGPDIELAAEDLELDRLSALLLPGMAGSEALAFLRPLLTEDVETLQLRQQLIGELVEKPQLLDALTALETLLQELEQAAQGVSDNRGGIAVTRIDAAMDGVKKAVLRLEKNLSKQGADILEENAADNRYAQLLRLTWFRKRQARSCAASLLLLRDGLHEAESPPLRALWSWASSLCAAEQAEKTLEALDGLDREWTGLRSFAVDVCLDGQRSIIGLEIGETREDAYPRAGMFSGAGSAEPKLGIGSAFAFPQNGSAVLFQEYLLSEVGYELRSTLTRQRDGAWKLPVKGTEELLSLRNALRFYTAAARFALRLREKGAPLCRPKPEGTEVLWVQDAYLPEQTCTGTLPVPNHICLLPGHSILLTGPNSSGKTCWLILCGQLLFLCQLGLLIPAQEARFSPRDRLLTLFAAGESETGADSRMGLEVQRLRLLQEQMTSRSLMLLNEPMTSTSAEEGGTICAELLASLAAAGVPAILVTHFHHIWPELRQRFAAQGTADALTSLVMTAETEAGSVKYLYRLAEAPPPPDSRARAVAEQAGASLPRLLELLEANGLPMHRGDDGWQQIMAGVFPGAEGRE